MKIANLFWVDTKSGNHLIGGVGTERSARSAQSIKEFVETYNPNRTIKVWDNYGGHPRQEITWDEVQEYIDNDRLGYFTVNVYFDLNNQYEKDLVDERIEERKNEFSKFNLEPDLDCCSIKTRYTLQIRNLY